MVNGFNSRISVSPAFMFFVWLILTTIVTVSLVLHLKAGRFENQNGRGIDADRREQPILFWGLLLCLVLQICFISGRL
jgi:hypothetical protein